MLTVGKHIGTVLTHALDQSQKTNTWFVRVQFAVENGIEDETSIPAMIWLSAKAMGIARKSLQAIGFDPDRQNLMELDANPVLLAGKKAEIELEENRGELRVKWINPLPKPKSKKTFDDLTNALRSAKQSKKDTEGFDEDGPKAEDIPF